MTDTGFSYDVAFSFLAQDEPLATQLNDLLKDRLKTFLYSERQKELAGTDGETTFGKVFGQEARVVVILYRAAWGTTPWTRIEELAIRNRAFEHGYDFALLVQLDTPPSKPQWFPVNRLWIGLDRWGAIGAAAAIEARAIEQGSNVREESVVERAARSLRLRDEANAREKFLRSYEGVQVARGEVVTVREAMERRLAEMSANNPPGPFQALQTEADAFVVTGSIVSMRAEFSDHYANNLENARLEMQFFRGPPYRRGASYIGEEPRQFTTLRFAPVGGDSRGFRWKSVGRDDSEWSSDQLADVVLKDLLTHFDEIVARGSGRPRSRR